MQRRRSEPEVNIFDCCPERAVGSEMDSGGCAVVLRPRFVRGPLARWLQPHLPRPYYRVRLDARGTFVWTRCDGRTTVAEIVAEMQERFEGDQEQVAERVQRFLYELERGGMIRVRAPGQQRSDG